MRKDKRGFTLIEILAAIVIFSILLTTLLGSFRFLSSSTDSLGKGTMQLEMARGCLSRMATDLEALYITLPPAYEKPDGEEDPDPYRLVGDSTYLEGASYARLRFTAFSHVSFGSDPVEGVAQIVYYIHEDADGDKVLRRSDRLFPYEEFEEKNSDPILCKNIRSLSFTYIDEAGEETEAWDSESPDQRYATPKAVGVKLSAGEEEAVFQTKIFLSVFREGVE